MICRWIKSLEKHKKKKTLFLSLIDFNLIACLLYVCKYRRKKYVSTWSSDYLIHIECSFWNISFRSICWGVKYHAVRDKGGELAILCVYVYFSPVHSMWFFNTCVFVSRINYFNIYLLLFSLSIENKWTHRMLTIKSNQVCISEEEREKERKLKLIDKWNSTDNLRMICFLDFICIRYTKHNLNLLIFNNERS